MPERVERKERKSEVPKNAFVFIGPPTSGKSSQSIFLSETALAQVVRGRDILPELVTDYENARTIIPDEIFVPSLISKLDREVAGQIVFDNIPRTQRQARTLVDWARKQGVSLHTIVLELTEEEVIERAQKRLVCPKCQEPYHPDLKPSKADSKCDKDGAPLVSRANDKPELLRRSYENYKQEEQALLTVLDSGSFVHRIGASGTVFETARRLFPELSGVIFQKAEMAAGYFLLRDLCDRLEIQHVFISGMPVYLYRGRALMKDFDILVPDDKIKVIAEELGLGVGEKDSSVAYTRFVDIKPGVEANFNLVVKADGKRIEFDFDFLWEEVRWVRFMGMECPIMGLEDLILLKAALGRFGPDDWGKHKDDLSDIEGLIGTQNVDWEKLAKRAEKLGIKDRLIEKLAQVNIQPVLFK